MNVLSVRNQKKRFLLGLREERREERREKREKRKEREKRKKKRREREKRKKKREEKERRKRKRKRRVQEEQSTMLITRQSHFQSHPFVSPSSLHLFISSSLF